MKDRNPTEEGESGNGKMVIAALSQSFSGPLPHPDVLARYDEIVPGAAERILSMAESQLRHRQGIESTAVTSNVEAQKRGVLLGFVLAMVAVLGGFYLAATGKPAYGLAAILTSLAGLVSVFVLGRQQQRAEREQKAKALSSTKSTRR